MRSARTRWAGGLLGAGTARPVRLCATVAAACLLALAATASAYTPDGQGGKPGKLVVVNPIHGSHYDACGPAFGYQCWVLWLYSGGPTVSRSSKTKGAQRVFVDYQLYRWESSGWAFKTRQQKQATIPRRRARIRLPDLNVLPSSAHGYGYWSGYIVFRWQTAGGRALGTRRIDMNQARDYRCSTQFASRCEVGAGWVRVVSPYT